MIRASAAHVKTARALLEQGGVGAHSTADECAIAAGRLYDEINARLASLLGASGVAALLARSVRLTRDHVECLADLPTDATSLRSCLQRQEPAVAMEAAVAVFATFLALTANFIGDRLMNQVVRGIWPAADDETTAGDRGK